MAMNWVRDQLATDGRATCAMGHDHRNYKEALACEEVTRAKTSSLSYTDTQTGKHFKGLIDRHKKKEDVDTNMEDPFNTPATGGFMNEALAVNHIRNQIGLADDMKKKGIKYDDKQGIALDGPTPLAITNSNTGANSDPFDVQFPGLDGATPKQLFQYLEKAKDLEKKTQTFIENIRQQIK